MIAIPRIIVYTLALLCIPACTLRIGLPPNASEQWSVGTVSGLFVENGVRQAVKQEFIRESARSGVLGGVTVVNITVIDGQESMVVSSEGMARQLSMTLLFEWSNGSVHRSLEIAGERVYVSSVESPSMVVQQRAAAWRLLSADLAKEAVAWGRFAPRESQ